MSSKAVTNFSASTTKRHSTPRATKGNILCVDTEKGGRRHGNAALQMPLLMLIQILTLLIEMSLSSDRRNSDDKASMPTEALLICPSVPKLPYLQVRSILSFLWPLDLAVNQTPSADKPSRVPRTRTSDRRAVIKSRRDFTRVSLQSVQSRGQTSAIAIDIGSKQSTEHSPSDGNARRIREVHWPRAPVRGCRVSYKTAESAESESRVVLPQRGASVDG